MGSKTQTTYLHAISDFRSKYPDLWKLNNYVHHHGDSVHSRAAVLQFGPGRSCRVEQFEDVSRLKTYISHTVGSACKHRLYLLEDLSRPFIEAFGSHFWMDPFLLAAHEDSTHWTGTKETYALPRRLSPSDRFDPLFTLRYYEVVRVDKSDVRPEPLKTKSSKNRTGRLPVRHEREIHREYLCHS